MTPTTADHARRQLNRDWLLLPDSDHLHAPAHTMDDAAYVTIVDDGTGPGSGSVLGGKAHHDITTFPAGLQRREYPTAVPA